MILKTSEFKYAQARKRILDAILAGDPAADAVLPSEQTLRKQLGIGRNTLRTALQELAEEGIILKQHGRQSRINPEALKKKRSPLRRIAWIDTMRVTQLNPVFFDIFRSLAECASARNVRLDYIPLSIEAVAENFFRRQLEYDGLVLGEFNLSFLNRIDRITHPNTVCTDCPRPGIPHCVKTDCYLGGQLAARALLESGCRNPAVFGYAESIAPHYTPFQERLRGFLDALEQAGIPPLPHTRFLAIKTAEEEDHFSDYLKKHLPVLKKTDCIFALTDKFAIDLLYSLQELGIRAPDDLGIIGFDGLSVSRFVSPLLTTIRQPVEEIGRKALEIVLNPTESKSYPKIIQFPPVLQPGGTLKIEQNKHL